MTQYRDIIEMVLSEEFKNASDVEKENLLRFHLKAIYLRAYEECEAIALQHTDINNPRANPLLSPGARRIAEEIGRRKRFLV
jgi:hypothetical protein